MKERREYFELSEANFLIPTLEFYFAELAHIQREANELIAKAAKIGLKLSLDEKRKPTGNKMRDKLQVQFDALVNTYADILDEIHELGVVIEDPDLGTVKFYSWVDGEEVVLSWQYGESEIKHWFKVTEDFMARRPLCSSKEPDSCQSQLH